VAIRYLDDVSSLQPEQLAGGFWGGWPDPPSPETHLAVLLGSEPVVVAVDEASDGVVGFVTAVGDGVLTAFIPLLEVLPAYRGQGIASELVRRVLARLGDRYSIDLVCDPALVPFYERLGGVAWTAMLWRNREAIGAVNTRLAGAVRGNATPGRAAQPGDEGTTPSVTPTRR
jgi:GNAT superfamily N-acetyltransferase